MVEPRVWALLAVICPKFRCFLLIVLRLAYRMLRMVMTRHWALLSAICLKFLLFFASSFKVGLENGRYGQR